MAPLVAGKTEAKQSPPSEVVSDLPSARLQGSGELRVLFFHVYDVRLWNSSQPVTADSWAQTPLALQIDYARSISSSDIADRSLLEMRRQDIIDNPDAATWLARLRELFPDVQAGDRLTALCPTGPSGGVRIFHNGTEQGRIDDPRFAKLFIGIWLSPQTSEPKLRRALLGEGDRVKPGPSPSASK
ncbi:MAG: chalcone isomerase family protein [Rubrivivax sp.]